jgi:uncharacterized membrane protein
VKGPDDNSRVVLTLALAAVFTALVCVATVVFVLPIPATKGYFNLGEIVIYVAALLFGPFVGGFAGGVGAALADVINGFSQFAPGTFAIKLIEGLIVGFIGRRATSNTKKAVAISLIAIVIGGLEMIAGYFAYEVGVISVPPLDALGEIPLNAVQMIVGLAFAVPIANIVRRVFPQFKS